VLVAAVCAEVAYPRDAAEFLRGALHAPAAGVSNAVTAWAIGLTGLGFNPAALDAIGEETIDVMVSGGVVEGLDPKRAGVRAAFPAGTYMAVAVSVDHAVREGGGRRGDSRASRLPAGDLHEGAVELTMAGRLRWPVSIGATVRYLYANELDERANGIGADIGTIYEINEHIHVGLSGRHVVSYRWWSTGEREAVAPTARAGVAGIVLDSALVGGVDVIKAPGRPVEVRGGLRYTILDLLALRAGVATALDLEEREARMPDVSLGAGVRYRFLGLDYALERSGPHRRLRHIVSASGVVAGR
jgi:hypothetical protein